MKYNLLKHNSCHFTTCHITSHPNTTRLIHFHIIHVLKDQTQYHSTNQYRSIHKCYATNILKLNLMCNVVPCQ